MIYSVHRKSVIVMQPAENQLWILMLKKFLISLATPFKVQVDESLMEMA